MNGYKILKCLRKESTIAGELSCPATGLVSQLKLARNFHKINHLENRISRAGSLVGCASACRRGFDPRVRQHSFVEIGHEIISTAILSLPLIQVGQLSVTGERMCCTG